MNDTTTVAAEKPHAVFGASASGMWIACPGSLAMSQGFEDTSSSYADEGTAAHEVAEMCLRSGQDAKAYAGRIITVERSGRKFDVDEEMVEGVQLYLDYVRGLGGELMLESEVDFTRQLEMDQWPEKPVVNPHSGLETPPTTFRGFGTSDAIVVVDDEVIVVDFKYGRNDVNPDAPQLKLYALGALDVVSLIADVTKVRCAIVQPRGDGPPVKEFFTTPAELEDFATKTRVAARVAWQYLTGEVSPPKLNPGPDQCKYCRAGKALACPALNAEARSVATAAANIDDFSDLTEDNIDVGLAAAGPEQVSDLMSRVDLLEHLCKAIRAETERRLLAGVEVPGFKLVEGKRGHRKWVNPEEAELQLRSMRLKVEEMFELKLISPTTAEKLAKAGTIGPRQWKKLQEQYAQSQGKPSVAPASDKRPALTVAATADDFALIEEPLV
jgi:hypothetical protein